MYGLGNDILKLYKAGSPESKKYDAVLEEANSRDEKEGRLARIVENGEEVYAVKPAGKSPFSGIRSYMNKNPVIKYACVFGIGALIVFGAPLALGGYHNTDDDNHKVRVIAHTGEEVEDAIANGCDVVRDARTLTALSCPRETARELKLQEDFVFAVQESDAHPPYPRSKAFVAADLVEASGNTGEGRTVVVLDSGYDYTHPELVSSYLGGYDFVNNDDDPMDDNGHGSAVAAVIAADGVEPEARGIAPDAKVIAGKIIDSSGKAHYSNLIAAIYWSVDGPDGKYGTEDDFNPDAINISIGAKLGPLDIGTSVPDYMYKDGFCDLDYKDLAKSMKYARDKGIVVVVAAGNNGSYGISIPGCISQSIAVGSVYGYGSNDVTGYSGRGMALDLVAPSFYKTPSLENKYSVKGGTSISAPIVTGTIALLKTELPDYAPDKIDEALFRTAKNLGDRGWDKNSGWGILNAHDAIDYALGIGR